MPDFMSCCAGIYLESSIAGHSGSESNRLSLLINGVGALVRLGYNQTLIDKLL